MKNYIPIFLYVIILTIGSCTPKITPHLIKKNLSPLPTSDSIYIVELGDTIPKSSIWVGRVYVGDGMTSKNCSLKEELDQVKKEIGKYGANVGKIISIKQPDPFVECFQLCLNIYKVSEEDLNIVLNQDYECQLDADTEYATIYFYHTLFPNGTYKASNALFNTIQIYNQNQKEFCRLSSGYRHMTTTNDFGPQKIILFDSNIRNEFDVDIQKGCEYYFEIKYEFVNKYKIISKLTLTNMGVKNGRMHYKNYIDKS